MGSTPSQITGAVDAENFQISKDGIFMSRWVLADESFSTRGLGGGREGFFSRLRQIPPVP